MPGVRLRPLSLDDVETLAAWGLDPEFCAAAEWREGRPLAYHREYWRRLIQSPPDDLLRLAVVEEDDRLVGYVDLLRQNPNNRELGFVIGERSLWGKGIGTRAALLALDHGFNVLGLTTITAEAWDANPGSIRILQRIGMQETGLGEQGEYRVELTFMRRFAIEVDGVPDDARIGQKGCS